MDLDALLSPLRHCSCGRPHTVQLKAVEIGSGVLERTGALLKENGFPTNLLVVADQNTLRAADGILDILRRDGFTFTLQCYDDLRTAEMTEVERIEQLCAEKDGVLSVGSGSLNDICRLATFRKGKRFAIFATAPSMDGFASDSAPITKNNFKLSYQCHQPEIILADTRILAKAPAVLKAAGFGDMVAKYIAVVDWKLAALTVEGLSMMRQIQLVCRRDYEYSDLLDGIAKQYNAMQRL